MSHDKNHLPPIDQQSSFAIPIVLLVTGNPPQVGEALALCYGPKHFCLLDEAGQQMARLEDRERLAEIKFANFWTGQPVTEIIFDDCELNGVLDRKHSRHLKLWVEQELAKCSPKLLNKLSEGANRQIIGGALSATLGLVVLIVGIINQERVPKFFGTVAAIGIAVMIRGWIEKRRLSRVMNPQALEAATEVEQVANDLPDPAFILSDLPTVRDQFLRSERRKGLAGLSTIGAFVTLAVAVLLWLYVLNGLGRNDSLPKVPRHPDGVAVTKPQPPFELPRTSSELIVISPDSESFDVTFVRQATPFGWWVARNAKAACETTTIDGKSLEDPPFREWSRDLVENGLGRHPQVTPVVPRLRFERPADGWPSIEKPELLSVSMDFVTPNFGEFPRYTATPLTAERHWLVLDSARFATWQKHQHQADEYARWKSEADAYNAAVTTFNQQLNAQVTQKQARRPREIACLTLIIALTTLCVGVPLIQLRVIRLIVNAVVVGTALSFIIGAVQHPVLPEPLNPITEALGPAP